MKRLSVLFTLIVAVSAQSFAEVPRLSFYAYVDLQQVRIEIELDYAKSGTVWLDNVSLKPALAVNLLRKRRLTPGTEGRTRQNVQSMD